MSTDERWQKLPKSRRAAVYRAIGHASREARLDGLPELAEDVRLAMDVVRTHAKGPKAKASRAKSKRPARKRRSRR